jgi:TIR domain
MAHDVFISYSHKDKPTADAVCARLEARGIRCWVAPRDIAPGGDWSESIIDAINGANVMVLVFSGHANGSVQIKREVERAVAKAIPIIPLRIEDVPPTKSLEYFLSTPHWLDALTPPLERHLDYLADVVRRILDGAPGEGLRAPAPPPLPIYRRRDAMAAGAAAAAVLAGLGAWAVLRPGTPPSFVGKWQSKKTDIDLGPANAGTSLLPLGELIHAAFRGPDVAATLEVTDAGQYRYSASVEDHGTVSFGANGNLTFTSAISKLADTRRATLYAPDKVLSDPANLGGQPGDSELVLERADRLGSVFVGKPTKGIVGQWHTTPIQIAYRMWNTELAIAADGTYRYRLSRLETGILEAADGKWTATFGREPPDIANYRFDGLDLVTVNWPIGSIAFQRAK